MRQLTCILLLMFSFFACKNLQGDTVKDFIPGTYVRALKDEFTTGKDSLIIRLLNLDGGSYLITQRSGYRQKIDGKVLPWVNKTEKFTAVYDKEHRQLLEQQRGKIFSFLPEKGMLLTGGGTEYKKIK